MKPELIADICEVLSELPWLAKLYTSVYTRTGDKKQASEAVKFCFKMWLEVQNDRANQNQVSLWQ